MRLHIGSLVGTEHTNIASVLDDLKAQNELADDQREAHARLNAIENEISPAKCKN
jgi:hypothetical protein